MEKGERMLRVGIENKFSSKKEQETGMAQSSTLSITLFAITINVLYKMIPREVHLSMFVDDI